MIFVNLIYDVDWLIVFGIEISCDEMVVVVVCGLVGW